MHSPTCLMKFLNKSSEDCKEQEFRGEQVMTENYGTVQLHPFSWYSSGMVYPNFNITFRRIRWKNLKFRFIEIGSINTQFCREFEIEGDVDPTSVISFDCFWSGSSPGKQFRFQYLLTTSDSYKFLYTYLLQIPKETDVIANLDVTNYHIFTLMDQTDFPSISAKIHIPPFNVTNITMSLFYKEDMKSNNIKLLKSWDVDLENDVLEGFATVGPYNTKNMPGYYYFNTSFFSYRCNNSCSESSTPTLHISGSRIDSILIIAIVFICLSTCGLAALFIMKSKNKKLSNGKINVLFVYESDYPSHIENIYKFREFLYHNCYVMPKMDLKDIPKTDVMNPWKWYSTAFEEADFVLVFASPDKTSEKGIHEDNVYHNLHTYAFKLLINNYLSNKNSSRGHSFKVAGVVLPGCSWDQLPREVKSLFRNKFSLPMELNSLLKLINLPPMYNGASKLLAALQQSREIPQFPVSRAVLTSKPPQVIRTEDAVPRTLVIPGDVQLKLDNQTSSDEDECEDGRTLIIM